MRPSRGIGKRSERIDIWIEKRSRTRVRRASQSECRFAQ